KSKRARTMLSAYPRKAWNSRSEVIRSVRSIWATARFISPREVFVIGEVLRAEKIFINVGGHALIPDIPGLNKVDYFTNSSILNVDFVPPHLLVIGGSYVGLEFAQMYRRFGSAVTVIETASRLIPREDEDTSAAIADVLRGEDIDILVNAKGL